MVMASSLIYFFIGVYSSRILLATSSFDSLQHTASSSIASLLTMSASPAPHAKRGTPEEGVCEVLTSKRQRREFASVSRSNFGHYCLRLESNDHPLTSVKLSCWSHVTRQRMEFLAHCLKSNTVIVELDMSHMHGRLNNEMLSPLFNVTLQQSRTISTLDLSWCNLPDQAIGLLSQALTNNQVLRKITIDYSRIDNSSACLLGHSLAGQTSLQELNLRCNKIGDEGAIAIASGLSANSCLSSLDLSGNPLGMIGNRALLHCLNPTTPNAVPNLSLQHIFLGSLRSPGYDSGTIQKIHFYTALNRCGRQALRMEEEIPLGLWPHILSQAFERGGPSIGHFLLSNNPRLFYPID